MKFEGVKLEIGYLQGQLIAIKQHAHLLAMATDAALSYIAMGMHQNNICQICRDILGAHGNS